MLVFVLKNYIRKSFCSFWNLISFISESTVFYKKNNVKGTFLSLVGGKESSLGPNLSILLWLIGLLIRILLNNEISC